MPVVAYVLLAVSPAAAMYVVLRGFERWVHGHRPRRGDAPAGRSLEQLVADLRRLEAEHRRISAGDLPGRVARLRTVSLAYDDALRACCLALGLEPPAVPLDPVTRLETEAALAASGLSW